MTAQEAPTSHLKRLVEPKSFTAGQKKAEQNNYCVHYTILLYLVVHNES